MGGYRRRSGSDSVDQGARPMGLVIDALSTRWGVLTVEAIHRGHTRFNELRRYIAGISHKVLIDTLRAMQRDGFVVGPLCDPGLTEYLLTDLGKDLVELIGDLRTWSEDRWPQISRAHAEFDLRNGSRPAATEKARRWVETRAETRVEHIRAAKVGRVIGTLSARWGVPTVEAIHDGHTHFNELQRKHHGINHKVLIDTLRSLQRDGFVHGPLTGTDRTDIAGYALTELGVDLIDFVADIRRWSADRWPELDNARHRFDRRGFTDNTTAPRRTGPPGTTWSPPEQRQAQRPADQRRERTGMFLVSFKYVLSQEQAEPA